MSETAENMVKPKRKYTRRKSEATSEPVDLSAIPQDEAPAHFTPCCVIERSYWEKSEINDERIRKFDRCGEPSTWQPKIIFKGREMRLRKNEEGRPEQYRGSKVSTMPVVWQPVCAKHKAEIQKNPRVILTNEWVRQQTRSFIDMGFPPIEPEMTRMSWSPYIFQEQEEQSDVLDILSGIANERAAVAKQDFTNIPQDEADAVDR